MWGMYTFNTRYIRRKNPTSLQVFIFPHLVSKEPSSLSSWLSRSTYNHYDNSPPLHDCHWWWISTPGRYRRDMLWWRRHDVSSGRTGNAQIQRDIQPARTFQKVSHSLCCNGWLCRAPSLSPTRWDSKGWPRSEQEDAALLGRAIQCIACGEAFAGQWSGDQFHGQYVHNTLVVAGTSG